MLQLAFWKPLLPEELEFLGGMKRKRGTELKPHTAGRPVPESGHGEQGQGGDTSLVKWEGLGSLMGLPWVAVGDDKKEGALAR